MALVRDHFFWPQHQQCCMRETPKAEVHFRRDPESLLEQVSGQAQHMMNSRWPSTVSCNSKFSNWASQGTQVGLTALMTYQKILDTLIKV